MALALRIMGGGGGTTTGGGGGGGGGGWSFGDSNVLDATSSFKAISLKSVAGGGRRLSYQQKMAQLLYR